MEMATPQGEESDAGNAGSQSSLNSSPVSSAVNSPSPFAESTGDSKDESGSAASVHHNLPKVVGKPKYAKIAQTKASMKQYPENLAGLPNLVSQAEMNGPASSTPTTNTTNTSASESSEPETEETPAKSHHHPQPNLPTPPSEALQAGDQGAGPPVVHGGSGSPTTPIKLRIRRMGKGEQKLISTVSLGAEGEQGDGTTTPCESVDSSCEDGTIAAPPAVTAAATKAKVVYSKLSEALGHVIPDGSGQALKKAGRKPKDGTATPPVEDDKPPTWLVGDLVWSKVSGHPWWPCMVTYDPHLGIFTKIKKYGKTRSLRSFHMQFFGDAPERGWVSETSTLPFLGLKEFEEYRSKALAEAPKKSRHLIKKGLSLHTNRKAKWEVALASAEEALLLTRNERKHLYTFDYEDTKCKKKKSMDMESSSSSRPGTPSVGDLTPVGSPASVDGSFTKTKKKYKKKTDNQEVETVQLPNGQIKVKRKRKSSKNIDSLPPHINQSEFSSSECLSDTEMAEKQSNRKSQIGDVSYVPPDEAATFHPSLNSPKGREMAQYMVFCERHRGQVSKEHPGISNKKIQTALKEKWKKLGDDERSRYIPMGPNASIVSKKASSLKDTQDVTKKGRSPIKSNKTTRKRKYRKSSVEEEGEESVLDTISSVASGAGAIEFPKGKEGVEIGSPPRKRQRKAISNLIMPSPAKSEQVADTGKRRISITNTDDEEEEDYSPQILTLLNSGPAKKENICLVCEQPGEIITCEGPCSGCFHLNCLGLRGPPSGSFRCDHCTTGLHTCFACKEESRELVRCMVAHCGKFYHEKCVKDFKLTRHEGGRSFVCPLHCCATCAYGNPKTPKATKGRLFRCVRCPTAYHVGDHCIAAGSIHLAGFHIVCSKHFQPVKTQKHHSHVNVSWCFVCSKGGTLLCCEACPAAFHAECLKIDFPDGSWYCNDCRNSKRPLYGDIIWVKLGSYRWWPGEICHPRNVPLNIQEKVHQVGEFPVRFFGSHDYFWTHQARVFLFQEGDKGSKDSTSSKGLAKVFGKAVVEATETFKLWKQAKANKEQQETQKEQKKPPPFRYIKTNLPYGNVTIYKADLSEIPRCECKPNSENPCGSDTECINRMLQYECHPSVCPAQDKCQNQRFQKRQYPPAEPIKTEGRGWGLKSLADIKKGQFVNEYVGELIDEEECKQRIKKAHDENITNFYMLTLSNNRIIDAGPKANLSRFMNHCCQPNCETQKWNVNGDVRVGLFALDDIKIGNELTFNYNLDCLGNEKTPCHCGATNCSGFIGVRPKSTASAQERKVKEPKKKKKKKHKTEVKLEHEDECYRCGEGGELLMCDKPKCPKAYHLGCLSIEKPPHGKWECPCHFCDTCGKQAANLCADCPNSFCNAHAEEGLKEQDGRRICLEHDEDDDEEEANGAEETSKTSQGSSNKKKKSGKITRRKSQPKVTPKVEPKAANHDSAVSSANEEMEVDLPVSPTKKRQSRGGGNNSKKRRSRTATAKSATKKVKSEPKTDQENIAVSDIRMEGKADTEDSAVECQTDAKDIKSAIKDEKLEINVDLVNSGKKKELMFDDADDEFGLVIDIPTFK